MSAVRLALLGGALALLAGAARPQVGQEKVSVTFQSPDLFLEGEPYEVTIRVVAPDGVKSAEIQPWILTPAAFTLDGTPLGERPKATDRPVTLQLQPGQVIESRIDLGPVMREQDGFLEGANLRLDFAPNKELGTKEVRGLALAERGIVFGELPLEQLDDYEVVLFTKQGQIWLKMWPEVAPGHVRNYLDLAYTGFYDDSKFHRVIPGFMIQGGSARPERPAPRTLKAEFSPKKHAPGVLSMARLGNDENSASCEFFIMHANNASLDGKYSAFGEVLYGLDTVDRIARANNPAFPANTPKGWTPPEDQSIYKAVVVKAAKGR